MSGTEIDERRYLSRLKPSGFLRNALREPLSVGALVPSSRFLAKLLVYEIKPGSKVIELGAGTGTITQAILNTGVYAQDLTLIEQNEEFTELLKQRFPETTVIQANAASFRRHLAPGTELVDSVVSGLPLLLFPARFKVRLLAQIFKSLHSNGCLYQFTYGGACPISRKLRRTLSLKASLIGFTPFNVPPAFVYRITRN
ncbi:MAG: class I SAM-dependent methyltransferase [Candidatus Rariloculaceae bacterium]